MLDEQESPKLFKMMHKILREIARTSYLMKDKAKEIEYEEMSELIYCEFLK